MQLKNGFESGKKRLGKFIILVSNFASILLREKCGGNFEKVKRNFIIVTKQGLLWTRIKQFWTYIVTGGEVFQYFLLKEAK